MFTEIDNKLCPYCQHKNADFEVYQSVPECVEYHSKTEEFGDVLETFPDNTIIYNVKCLNCKKELTKDQVQDLGLVIDRMSYVGGTQYA